MDPQTLKPPQLVTLSYGLTTASNGKPFSKLEPIYGALMHSVIISRDLLAFRHTYTSNPQADRFSMLTQFPEQSKYYNFTIFKPAGEGIQTLEGTIQAANAGAEPALVPDADRAKLAYGSRFELISPTGGFHAGKPVQLVVYASERGAPITTLWPFLGAPAYMWVISEDGTGLAVEQGASEGRSTTNGSGTAVAAPTYMPELHAPLSTRTAEPVSSLVPVQQTALVSVVETPGAVVPDVGYGPSIAFTHTFDKPGLHKIWVELQYRGQVITVDWVLDVKP